MFNRSRWHSRSLFSLALLLMTILILAGATGCSRTQPRKHWWEFWKPKATATDTVYHPDREILPPPPGVLDATGKGESSTLPAEMPPPPTIADASRIAEPAPVRGPAQSVSELYVIHFTFDSSELSGEAQRQLDQNGQWLAGRPNYEVSIEGHCDERGTEEYNMNLGMRRAKVVRDYLVSKGIAANRLHTTSYGEMRPLDPAHTEEVYTKNRRVQFLVY
jgi:peptidoglycan-associated lipoprotein